MGKRTPIGERAANASVSLVAAIFGGGAHQAAEATPLGRAPRPGTSRFPTRHGRRRACGQLDSEAEERSWL